MKFGKDLALNMVAKWEVYYIDYESLKLILHKGQTTEIKVEFRSRLAVELEKVSGFHLKQVAEFEAKIEGRKNRAAASPEDAYTASDSHYEVFRDLSDLKTFGWINAEGFRKIMKKFDKMMSLRGTDDQEAPAFEATLRELPFMSAQIQGLLDSLKQDKKWNFKILSGTANLPLAVRAPPSRILPQTYICVATHVT
jgi:SPX domain protein involved in polyphosphate accumulation